MLVAIPVALLPLPDIVFLIGIVCVTILACIDPVWSLYIVILSVPVQELVYLPGGLSYTQAAFILVAATWVLRILAYPERPIVFGQPALGLAILVWALALATAYTSYSLMESVRETLRWFTVVLVYVVALNSTIALRNESADWQWRGLGLVICLLVAPAVTGLIGLWQFATGIGPQSFVIAGGRFVRAYGTIGQPNSFAGYMNMAWPLALAMAVGMWGAYVAGERTKRPIYMLAALFFTSMAGILIAALGASFSRGGWVGAGGGAAVLILATAVSLGPQARRYIWRGGIGLVIGGGVVVGLGGANLLPSAVTQRVNSITRNLRLFDVRTVEVSPENFAVVERMAHLQAAWAMITTYPLTGVGPGNFTLAYEGHGDVQDQPFGLHPWYASRGHAHNYYLHIAAEAGILGFLAYIVLLGLLAKQAYATLCRVRGWFWCSVAIGICGVLAAMGTHNLFENLHVLNMGVQLGALWGLLVALEKTFETAQWPQTNALAITSSSQR